MPSIGSMFASLSLESASFMSGLDAARKSLGTTQKRFADIGSSMQRIGGVMTAGMTAPFAALGAAALGGARELAASVGEIQKSAQLAGVSTTEFQKLAFAAKSVGFESEKLTDVFKDVNDRVGEFLSTGGGEMKDFFENVAPKVGITAEAFRNLSGPQALQLYYDSLQKAGLNQQQITFYMEAMADEATALVPLLQNGGKAMAEMGSKAAIISPADAENLKRYTEAQRGLEQAMQKVTIAVVSSGLLEGLTGFITKAAEITERVAAVNPEIVKWGIAIGSVGAAIGPVVLGLGTLVKGVGLALPVFLKFGGFFTNTLVPVLATVGRAMVGLAIAGGPLTLIAAGATAAYLAWKNWDKIGPFIRELVSTAKTWLVDKLQPIFDTVRKGIAAVHDSFNWLTDKVTRHSYVPEMVDGIATEYGRLKGVMVDPALAAIAKVQAGFASLPTSVPAFQMPAGGGTGQMPGGAGTPPFAGPWGAPANDNGEALSELGKMTQVLREIGAVGTGSFGQVTQGIVAMIEQVQAAKSGVEGLGGAMGGLTGLFQGIFGKKVGGILGGVAQIGLAAARAYGGARANGGPVMPRRDYLVGERGPEILRMGGAGGRIVPNDQIQQGSYGGGETTVRIEVQEGPMFRPVIRSEAALVVQGAQRGSAMAARQRI